MIDLRHHLSQGINANVFYNSLAQVASENYLARLFSASPVDLLLYDVFFNCPKV
jgi:hypothetical protein